MFPPYDDEEQQTNPGIFGKRLAEFLRNKLRAEGIKTQEPVAEDWGWSVPVANESFRMWIGCGRYQEYPDGFLLFIEPHAPYIRRSLKKLDIRDRVTALQQAIDRVLAEEPGIWNKHWWTHEQFNAQARK
jgi:hypothetical protein